MTVPIAFGWSETIWWDSHPLEFAAYSRRAHVADNWEAGWLLVDIAPYTWLVSSMAENIFCTDYNVLLMHEDMFFKRSGFQNRDKPPLFFLRENNE